MFSFNFDDVQKEINECMQGLKEKGNIKTMLMNKSKKPAEVELYLKKINTENAILGIIHPVESSNKYQNELSFEISQLVDYFKDQENAFMVDEINSALKLLNIEKSVEVEKIKSRIKLSAREVEVLEYICKGFTNQEIADKLFLSARTVDNHRAKILEKTNTRNAAELVGFAVKNKLVNLD